MKTGGRYHVPGKGTVHDDAHMCERMFLGNIRGWAGVKS